VNCPIFIVGQHLSSIGLSSYTVAQVFTQPSNSVPQKYQKPADCKLATLPIDVTIDSENIHSWIFSDYADCLVLAAAEGGRDLRVEDQYHGGTNGTEGVRSRTLE
jgi:hypothetical protein